VSFLIAVSLPIYGFPFLSNPKYFYLSNPSNRRVQNNRVMLLPLPITSGLGWILGGPMGAAVVGGATYLLNQITQTTEPEQPAVSAYYLEQLKDAYADAASDYLTRFSTQAFSTLRQYEEIVEKIINYQVTEKPSKLTIQHHQLQLLETLLDNLNHELESVRVILAK
jgi:hypothetical protein